MNAGEIVGLIGPNGAGKTTLVNVVTGMYPATAGRVRFNGQDITRLAPNRIAQLGVARTFQIVQPFPRMTVGENIAAGALFAGGARSLAEARARARELAQQVGIGDLIDQPAETLTLARRKRFELAKSLAMRPKLLFLDEVNAGLNPAEIDEALRLISKIAQAGVTIVVIEHLMKVVLVDLDAARRPPPRSADCGRTAAGGGARSARCRGLSWQALCRGQPWSIGHDRATSADLGLESGYGEVQVLWGIDLDVAAGEIVCVIGSNGAGKTHAVAHDFRLGARLGRGDHD